MGDLQVFLFFLIGDPEILKPDLQSLPLLKSSGLVLGTRTPALYDNWCTLLLFIEHAEISTRTPKITTGAVLIRATPTTPGAASVTVGVSRLAAAGAAAASDDERAARPGAGAQRVRAHPRALQH